MSAGADPYLVRHHRVPAALDQLRRAERRGRMQAAADKCRPGVRGGRPEPRQCLGCVGNGRSGWGAELELCRVGVMARRALVDVHADEHGLGDRRELVRARVDEEKLFLDPHRETGPEGDAAHRPSSADTAATRPRTSAAASPLA